MPQKRVAVIEGDDASPEAVRPTVELIDNMKLGIEWVYPPVGASGEALHDSIFPEEARRLIDDSDTTLFGAASGKSAFALLYLRWGKQTYANVRPTRWIPDKTRPYIHEPVSLAIRTSRIGTRTGGVTCKAMHTKNWQTGW